jgi:hypothetical protein
VAQEGCFSDTVGVVIADREEGRLCQRTARGGQRSRPSQGEAIDLPAAVVVAKSCTLPTAVDEDIWLDHMMMFEMMFDAIARTLADLPHGGTGW